MSKPLETGKVCLWPVAEFHGEALAHGADFESDGADFESDVEVNDATEKSPTLIVRTRGEGRDTSALLD